MASHRQCFYCKQTFPSAVFRDHLKQCPMRRRSTNPSNTTRLRPFNQRSEFLSNLNDLHSLLQSTTSNAQSQLSQMVHASNPVPQSSKPTTPINHMASLAQTLCVLGYIRENCGHCILPDDLLNLCVSMYAIEERWDANRCDNQIEIERDGSAVSICKERNNYKCANAFGRIEVRRGEMMKWRFKIPMDKKIQNMTRLPLYIGVIATDKVTMGMNTYFAANIIDSLNVSTTGGYALYGLLGKLCIGGRMSDYGTVIKPWDTIEMMLDMTESKTKGLSFKINEVDYGVAYDGFDMEQTYCMALCFRYFVDGLAVEISYV